MDYSSRRRDGRRATRPRLSSIPSRPLKASWRKACFRKNRPRRDRITPFVTTPFLIGSININGLSGQSAWAIEDLLTSKPYQVFAISETHFRLVYCDILIWLLRYSYLAIYTVSFPHIPTIISSYTFSAKH